MEKIKKYGKVCDPEKEAIIDSKTIGFYEKCRFIWGLCWIRAISRRIPSVGVNHPNGQFIVCRRPRRQDSCSLLYHPLPQSFQWSASLKDGCWDGSMLVVGEGEGVALLMTAENYDQRTFAPSTGSHHCQSLHGNVVFIWLSSAWENTIFRENRRANTIVRKNKCHWLSKVFGSRITFCQGSPVEAVSRLLQVFFLR